MSSEGSVETARRSGRLAIVALLIGIAVGVTSVLVVQAVRTEEPEGKPSPKGGARSEVGAAARAFVEADATISDVIFEVVEQLQRSRRGEDIPDLGARISDWDSRLDGSATALVDYDLPEDAPGLEEARAIFLESVELTRASITAFEASQAAEDEGRAGGAAQSDHLARQAVWALEFGKRFVERERAEAGIEDPVARRLFLDGPPPLPPARESPR